MRSTGALSNSPHERWVAIPEACKPFDDRAGFGRAIQRQQGSRLHRQQELFGVCFPAGNDQPERGLAQLLRPLCVLAAGGNISREQSSLCGPSSGFPVGSASKEWREQLLHHVSSRGRGVQFTAFEIYQPKTQFRVRTIALPRRHSG